MERAAYLEEYERWCREPLLDEASRAELIAIAEDEKEIEFRFAKSLEFGTAGLRGIMKAGLNAMNVYTVGRATQGLADYICRRGREAEGVAVGMDSRNHSPEFARITAEILAANGIRVFLFDALRPTPMLSFAVRRFGCCAGVNVTASHNPAAYNGYKVYWDDGCQIPEDIADEITANIADTDIFTGVKHCDYDAAVASGRITLIDESFDEQYLTEVLAEQVSGGAVAEVADSLRIVYTPLHGAGYRLVPEVLRRIGVRHVFPVAEQMVLDGNFPTVVSPNPENPEAFELALRLAEEVDSDLIIATDPDADRVAVMAKRSSDGKFVNLTGNQTGALLIDFILNILEKNGTMPEDPYLIKSIVTTELVAKLAEEHGVTLYNCLTGFKFIGEVIRHNEEAGRGTFVFGFEESYGYLKGTYARDKDSVVASMLVTEMAAYYKKQGKTLADALEALFARYGYYIEGVKNIYMEGLDGIRKMAELMELLRSEPPKTIGGQRVTEIRDYLTGQVKNLETGAITETGLARSNVLYYTVETGDRIIMRPSGTEPKIKLYMLTSAPTKEEAERQCKAYMEDTETFTD